MFAPEGIVAVEGIKSVISETVIINGDLVLHQGNCHYSIVNVNSVQKFNRSSVQSFESL